jgi:glutaminyl-tRNA synthetase
MYDYAHPLEDVIERVTHSLCSLEFEDHRPLYDWCVNETDAEFVPRQIEFAKLNLTNTIMGKRYMRALVESGKVDGWDDPRLVTISGMRRRGYPAEALRDFCDRVGVAKANSVVDIALLEHCVRENLKPKAKTLMAVLKPLKVVITNYPENVTEGLTIENNGENPDLGVRTTPFSREIYVERDDFMEDAPTSFHRLSVGREVRLKGAYFIKCDGVVKDETGFVTELLCSYDPETKSGSGFTGRKVKGTIHWVSAPHAIKIETRLYDCLVFDSPEGQVENPNSLITNENSYVEPEAASAAPEDRFQFLRVGYFCLDIKRGESQKMVFNQIVPLKSSYKPGA